MGTSHQKDLNKMKKTKITEPAVIPHAGVFTGNKRKPIHRWYPYIEGYSADLVEWALKVTEIDDPHILDPFGGSGTTNLVAAEHNLTSSFCEVNPFMAWMADTKINQSKKIKKASDLHGLLEFKKFMKSLPKKHKGDLAYTTIVEIDSTRHYFPEGIAIQIAMSLTWIDQTLNGPIRQLARAAVAVSLVPSSCMIRRTDLRRRISSDTSPVEFLDCVTNAIDMIIEDLSPERERWTASANLVSADIRELQPKSNNFDLIVTSPPYLNGTNYCRNTKLELLSLEFLSSESGLSKFRMDSITAGINSVSKQRTLHKTFDNVETVAGKLDECSYDKRIPPLVRLYFSDMTDAFEQMRLSSSKNAQLILDIGDSKFSGVHIPTDLLLIECAESVGWRAEESFPVRKRRSFDGSELKQVVIRFSTSDTKRKKPGTKL